MVYRKSAYYYRDITMTNPMLRPYELTEHTNKKSGRKWYIVRVMWWSAVKSYDARGRQAVTEHFEKRRLIRDEGWEVTFKYKSETEAREAISVAILKGLVI